MTPLPSALPRPRFTWMSTVLGAAFAAAAAIAPESVAEAPDAGGGLGELGMPAPSRDRSAKGPPPAAPPPTRPAISAATTIPVRPRDLSGFSRSAVPPLLGGM